MLLAQAKYKCTFELPRVSFNLKSSKTAGLARLSLWHIEINPRFLVSHTEEILRRTVTHEIAHLITFKLFPTAKQCHGPEFRSVCAALGIEGTTYHTMQLPDVQKYTWICNCRKWHLSNLINRRMLAGQTRRCRKCRGVLIKL